MLHSLSVLLINASSKCINYEILSCVASSERLAYWILNGVVLIEDYDLLTLRAYNLATVSPRPRGHYRSIGH